MGIVPCRFPSQPELLNIPSIHGPTETGPSMEKSLVLQMGVLYGSDYCSPPPRHVLTEFSTGEISARQAPFYFPYCSSRHHASSSHLITQDIWVHIESSLPPSV
jgi:hypothetical protein